MKKFFALPLAVLFVAACSDSSTAPATNADLSPSYAKPVKPPAGGGGGGITNVQVSDTYNFEGIDAASGNSTVGTALQPGIQGDADAPAVIAAPNGSTHFIGRFDNTRTIVVVNLAAGYPKYDLNFDFYVIGSWDGRGKQAQSGVFEANVFDISYQCGVNAPLSIFKTSFSNQKTVQQDFPLAYLTGGNKAATGSFDTDALGYKDRPDLSNTPQFRSFGDVSYHMSFAGTNPCGMGAVQFQIGTSNPTQQSTRDESWGVDNIVIKAGT